MLASDIAFVADTLTDIDVDAETIKTIIGILEDDASDLHDGKPDTLGAASLGQSDSGALLAHHTALAHRAVVDSMTDMVTGLRGYAANLSQYHKEMSASDDASHGAGHTISAKVSGMATPSLADATTCAAAPDVTPNNACTLPSGGN